LAKKQSGGYGRKGQAWYSPAGGLYFSVIMPKSNIDDLQLITIFAAVAVGQIIKMILFWSHLLNCPMMCI